MIKKKRIKKLSLSFILLLISIINFYHEYSKIKLKRNSFLKIFIMTHKDFKNYIYNPIYYIVADDKSQLKRKYNLPIIYADKGKLYNKKRAYGEMSKLYYIYQLYKSGEISSKYIGLNHYKRYLNCIDKIHEFDNIFENYDIILEPPHIKIKGMKKQFCRHHMCKLFDEILAIIKDIKPEYYKTAIKTAKEKRLYFRNLFIMKTIDFFKYCKFMFDILFEFDKRNNLSSDEDVLNYVKKFYKEKQIYFYQSRLQGFLAERISNIFYYHHFKKMKSFGITKSINLLSPRDKSFIDRKLIEDKISKKESEIVILLMKIFFFLLLFLFINF